MPLHAGHDAFRRSRAPFARKAPPPHGGKLAFRADHERHVRSAVQLAELHVLDVDPADLHSAADEQQSPLHGADSHVADPLAAAELAALHAVGGSVDGGRTDRSDGSGRHRCGRLGSDVVDAGVGCEAR